MLTVRHNELFGSLLAYLLPGTQTSLRIVSSDNTDTIHHIATLLSVAFLLPTPTVAFALSQSITACFAAENTHARSENVRRGLENLGWGGKQGSKPYHACFLCGIEHLQKQQLEIRK